MAEVRTTEQPIVPAEPRGTVAFLWRGQKHLAMQCETMASARINACHTLKETT